MARIKHNFNNRDSLNRRIDEYFERSKNETDKHAAPITLTGLAVYLGFTSKEEFDAYEQKKMYNQILTRARFRVMAYYEGRLHYPSPTGAIFVLKSMGWDDMIKIKKPAALANSVTVNVIETGPQPASAEKRSSALAPPKNKIYDC